VAKQTTMKAPADLIREHGAEKVGRYLATLERHGDAVEEPELWLRTALSHDFKFTPIERVERCACGSGDHERLSRFVFWELLGIRRCRSCGLVFLSPRPTAEAMERIFNEHYFDPGDPDYWGSRRRPIFEDVARLLRRAGCRRVLDVGAAYGHFVRFLNDRGIAASGCDLSAAAVAWGRSRLGVDLMHGRVETLDLPDAAFDAVVALDTFYYVAEPGAHLRTIRRILEPGGHLVLRLRNNLRASARARRQGRVPIGRSVLPMPHLWGFTPHTAARLLEIQGFRTALCRAAVPSRSRLFAVERALVALDRAGSRFAGLGPLARSFDIVATR
jgi:SAM-dependent methyltransferase